MQNHFYHVTSFTTLCLLFDHYFSWIIHQSIFFSIFFSWVIKYTSILHLAKINTYMSPDKKFVNFLSEYRKLSISRSTVRRKELLVHNKFLSLGQTVNKEGYLSVMFWLRKILDLKRLKIWEYNNHWFLYHDNVLHWFLTNYCQKFNSYRSATSVFAWFGPMRLLIFSKLKCPMRRYCFDIIKEKNTESKILNAIPEKYYYYWN